jgi:hypothetical protein
VREDDDANLSLPRTPGGYVPRLLRLVLPQMRRKTELTATHWSRAEQRAVNLVVAHALRRMRKSAGLSAGDVALRVYGKRSYRPLVCRWERGYHLGSLEMIARVAEVCGSHPLYVFSIVDRTLAAIQGARTRAQAISSPGNIGE